MADFRITWAKLNVGLVLKI